MKHNFSPYIRGEVFGRLVAVAYAGRSKYGNHAWLCQCECGAQKVVEVQYLYKGSVKSCGCYRKEFAVQKSLSGESPIITKHGLSGTNLYAIWAGIRGRCVLAEHARYKGRGIKMCERWMSSFENFAEDMGERPTLKHTIERIDNDGNYEPANCRWATYLEQAANKSNNRMIQHDGRTLHLAEWARIYGMKVGTLWYRLKLGWTIEVALSTPVGYRVQ